MIKDKTFLKVRDWFITSLELDCNEDAFDHVLLSDNKFNFSEELIEFLDVINSNQLMRRSEWGLWDRDVWEINALYSIIQEAKKLGILKNVKCDMDEKHRYNLAKELIEKMKVRHHYCMIVCNFLASSNPANIPNVYNYLCILCKYWIHCKDVLKNHRSFERQLSGQLI